MLGEEAWWVRRDFYDQNGNWGRNIWEEILRYVPYLVGEVGERIFVTCET